MAALWKKLTSSLGAAFVNQYGCIGGDSFKIWTSELSEFSDDQIKNAYREFMDSDVEFLNLKKFKNFCRKGSASKHKINAPAYRLYKPIHSELSDEDKKRNERAHDHFISEIAQKYGICMKKSKSRLA